MTPHRPHSRDCDATYPCSSLCQESYITRKYIPFKKIRGRVTHKNETYKFLDVDIRKTY